jgi:hypothetical protein
MKKHSMMILAAALCSSTVFAGTLNFDFRGDYRSLGYNTDAATPSFNGFNIKTGRLDYQGKYNEDVSFRLRFGLNKDGTNASNTNDANLQKTVEYAYFGHKLADNLTLSVGRFNSDIGGFEGITAGSDLYMVSAGYAGSALPYSSAAVTAPTSIGGTTAQNATSATKMTATGTYLYITGARLVYKMDNQEVALMAANPVVYDSAQSRLMEGVVYKGAFMDKSLNLIASYHTSGVGVSGKDDNLTFMALGATYLFANNMVGIDMLSNGYKHTVATSTATETSSTMNVTYAYKGMDTVTPMLKYSSTIETPDSATSANKTTVTGMSAVVECKPTKDNNFRYFVAYSSMSNKVDTATTTPSSTELLVGMRVNADLLK